MHHAERLRTARTYPIINLTGLKRMMGVDKGALACFMGLQQLLPQALECPNGSWKLSLRPAKVFMEQQLDERAPARSVLRP
ncbi:hypothetical protein IFR05_011095 [Cadophora sp. M221]|nr:hypothetical protein IFR05_011095 [Cadophora sp. M221]